MKKLLIIVCFLAAILVAQNCYALGDTQGYVDKIVVNLDSGGTTIRVYFSSVQNDRWGCSASPGYVEMTTRSQYVSVAAIAMMYDTLMTAKQNNKPVGIDSPGGGVISCYQANTVWVVW
jgi:hypothetical protein